MRIVAGSFRGRRLKTPRSPGIRPTADRVREAIFSIIASHVPGAVVLDLFAGTGAMGLEALSRGAERAVFVDQGSDAVRLVRENVALCGAEAWARIIHAPLARALSALASEGQAFELIFLDPPYGKGLIELSLQGLDAVADPEALAVAEHSLKDLLPERCGSWVRMQERRYGDTVISFYECTLSRER